MKNVLEYTYPELVTFVTETLGEPRFRADQIWQWLWHRRAGSFEAMTDLSKKARALLQEHACIRLPRIEQEQVSQDGTIKLLLSLEDGELVETVLIPSSSRHGKERMTQCLSCQVGCAMGCTFCSTGKLGFTRNMTMGEILGQVLIAREYLQDDLDVPRLRNLVFMGMGEPLLNLHEVMRSLETLHSDKGLRFSARRITVSTCGIEKGLQELGESGLAYLAVSLHAPNQALREQLMPRAARWPLHKLLEALRTYPLEARERMTFEYLLLGGVNDSEKHAAELAKTIAHIKGKLNLIVYNPVPGAPYKAPTPAQVLAFEKVLWAKGVTAIVRKSKGQDIDAACGQLKAAVQAAPLDPGIG